MNAPTGNPPFMTTDDFIRIVGHRGYKLWILPSVMGMSLMTDGTKTYPLPRWLPGGLMGSELIWDLMEHFLGKENARLFAPDFHFDPMLDDLGRSSDGK